MNNIKFPVEKFPSNKKVLEIQPGIYWARFLLPSLISHVNLYVIEEIDGITIIDTGLSVTSCIDNWSYILKNEFKNKDIKRVIVTHHHPDHIGLIGWFKDNFGAEIWTSRSSWLTSRMLTLDEKDVVSKEVLNEIEDIHLSDPNPCV